MHKITSHFYEMRKILIKIFWSQGTPMGSSGSGSQEALGLGACRFQNVVIWGPCESPVLVASEVQAKNLKTAPSQSEYIHTRTKNG